MPEFNNCPLHTKRIDTPVEHEIRGSRATFTLSHTYKGTYPDGCKAPEHHRYVLHVNGQYIEVGDFHPDYEKNGVFDTLKEIAITMNVHEDCNYHD